MTLYLLTLEDTEDGMWFDEPRGYDSLQQAKTAAEIMGQPPEGHSRIIYRCEEEIVVAETPLLPAEVTGLK